MKIEKAKNEVIKRFDELKVGEAFILKEYFTSDICIKTYSFISEEFDELKENYEEESYNAFKLRNGDPFWCNDLTEVIIPNCKVIIE